MDTVKQQIAKSINEHSNILVTVSTDPSVDALSAALGLTLVLDMLDKRVSAVVSGQIPPAIKFLEPEKTFDNTADSLRDFIIALDKEKADHLRYKVEGDVVKIFITPYKTTLSQADLEFSQGDYNVELVLALGVKDQDHLDKALAAHGKILHDATVITITAGQEKSNLGSIDWNDPTASSVSEMITSIVETLKDDKPLLNEQIATALLTGIVAATDRFSNNHTTSQVMTMAAHLMAAGANQQLIAAKLEEAHEIGVGRVAGNVEAKPDSDQAEVIPQAPQDETELTIDRDDKSVEIAQPQEKVIEPPADVVTPAPEPAFSQEKFDQVELEKQLSGVVSPAPVNAQGSIDDIEKQLQEAVAEAEGSLAENASQTSGGEHSTNEPLGASSDASMPGFEPTAPVLPPPPPPPPSEPVTEAQSDQAEPPQITNDHGSFAPTSPETTPAINSIQDNPNEGEGPTVDPFSAPLEKQEAQPLNPVTPAVQSAPKSPSSNIGTPEGAALLESTDTINEPASMTAPPQEPSIPPIAEPQVSPMAMPVLPPLPPLPDDSSLPPLPPPPPPPTFGQPPAGSAPSGPVTSDQLNDIFGDATPAPQVSQVPAAPPEPGQFRIPGQ